MCDERRRERRIIPSGIRSRQNRIVSPKVSTSTPAFLRNLVQAKPYGPAPITATSASPPLTLAEPAVGAFGSPSGRER